LLFLPPFVLHLAPTHLGWDTRRQFTRRSKDPPGLKRRHLCTQDRSLPGGPSSSVSPSPSRCSLAPWLLRSMNSGRSLLRFGGTPNLPLGAYIYVECYTPFLHPSVLEVYAPSSTTGGKQGARWVPLQPISAHATGWAMVCDPEGPPVHDESRQVFLEHDVHPVDG
jgi:hypothetical protein